MKRFDRLALLILSVLVLSLAGVILFGHSTPVRVTCDSVNACVQISSFGSVEFTFSRAVDPDQVEALFRTIPSSTGHWTWVNDRQVRWMSQEPFASGQEVRLIFQSGVVGRDDESRLEEREWTAHIRIPRIIAVQELQDGTTELISVEIEGGQTIDQISHIGSRIADYAVSPDGETILLSVDNQQGGTNLWMVNRDGTGQVLLLDCQADRCSAPAWAPNLTEVVYTREGSGVEGEGVNPNPVLWLMDMESGETTPLSVDSDVTGRDPSWSPDGQWISVYDENEQGILIINRDSGDRIFLNTTSGDAGSWSPGSDTLYFTSEIYRQAGVQNVISAADLKMRTVSTIFGTDIEENGINYNHPVSSPAGRWIAVRSQNNVKIPGGTLMLVNPDTQDEVVIMDNFSQIFSFYSWTPDGQKLVFQIRPVNGESSDVTIAYWDNDTMQLEEVMQGACSPQWLP